MCRFWLQITEAMRSSDRRIARNTLYLYGRMLVTVWISLYTSRVVLERLGVEDYGVYGVVGGVVTILSFLNGTMSGATSRFISYELGRGDASRMRLTFGSAFRLHLWLGAGVLLLAETAGLWYVNTGLVIAPDRMAAANIAYQLSVVAALASIVQVPYSAAIISHERMDAYAVIALLNVVLKLGAALGIAFFASADSLAGYALLMAVAAVAVALSYVMYARRNFGECRAARCSDPDIRRAMMRFCGWDVYGNLCYTTRVQGVVVVLNRFGGTVLNAAGSLTLTVSATVTSFAASVVTAFRPQIIREYAAGAFGHMLSLLCNAARYSLLLMALIVVPAILEMDTLLAIWLKDVPPYTSAFCRLALVAACGELLNSVVAIGIHATGRVAAISFVSGTLYLLELPAMWLLLVHTGNPPVVYLFHIAAVFGILFVNTLILKHQLAAFGLRRFWWRGVLQPAMAAAASLFLTAAVACCVQHAWLRLAAVLALSAAATAAICWFFLLPADAKAEIRTRLRRLGQ